LQKSKVNISFEGKKLLQHNTTITNNIVGDDVTLHPRPSSAGHWRLLIVQPKVED
jgi:hypothetical protein